MKKCRKVLCLILVWSMVTILPGLITAQANAAIATPMLAAGGNHMLALKEDGSVWAWGDNSAGIFGAGLIDGVRPPIHETPVPVLNNNLNSVIAIAARDLHSLGLRADGTVWAWGSNSYGQLGDGSTTHFASPVQVQGLTTATAIAAGRWHSVALLADGTVWAWGNNESGQLGDGTTMDRHTPVQVQGLDNITAIAAGESHTIALKNDGTVWAWGNNSAGQLGDGTTTQRITPVQVQGLSGVTAIAAGFHHTIALKNNGTVWAWGLNTQGQLGDGTNANRNVPVQVNHLNNITAIVAGEMHTLAVRSDGTAWAFGDNRKGQLGDGTSISRSNAVQMQALDDVIAVAAGRNHSVALRSDGTVWAAGSNAQGQLGNGTTANIALPVQVLDFDGNGYLNLLNNPPTSIPAESVSISGDASRTMIIGDTLSLIANVAPAIATNKSVSWISSDPAVATVNASGLVQAVAQGEVIITATTASGGHMAAISVTVTPIPVAGISIAGDATRWLVVGQFGEIQLTATIAPANASNQTVTWASSDPAVATVSATGRVITRAVGTAMITATSADGGYTASVNLIVRVPVTSVSIAGDKFLSVTAGKTHQLMATVSPENATVKNVTWTSSNETVATVDRNGLVRAIAPGNAVIVVTTEDNNRASSVSIIVRAAAAPPYFSEGDATTLRYKGSKKLTCNSAAEVKNWASDRPDILFVDQDGNITGVSRGTARVIAIDSNGSSAEISVTVDYVWWQWIIVIFLFRWAWY